MINFGQKFNFTTEFSFQILEVFLWQSFHVNKIAFIYRITAMTIENFLIKPLKCSMATWKTSKSITNYAMHKFYYEAYFDVEILNHVTYI